MNDFSDSYKNQSSNGQENDGLTQKDIRPTYAVSPVLCNSPFCNESHYNARTVVAVVTNPSGNINATARTDFLKNQGNGLTKGWK